MPDAIRNTINDASMRPGQQSPRKRLPPWSGWWKRSGFNEAGATIAPETRLRPCPVDELPCFNEAGATIAPETPRCWCAGSSYPSRFNEAGATIAPETLSQAHPWLSATPIASMRPGQQSPRKLPAQPSHNIPRKPASMRPGQQSPRKPDAGFGEGPWLVASMRPGQQSPRKHVEEPMRRLVEPAASMRPGQQSPRKPVKRESRGPGAVPELQ